MFGMNVKVVVVWVIAISFLVTLVFIFENLYNSKIVPNMPKFASRHAVQNQENISKDVDVKVKNCKYTRMFPGGYGAKIHDMIYAWSWAFQNNATYKGAIGSSGQTKTLLRLIRLLKLPFGIQARPFKNCTLLPNEIHRKEHWIQINPFFKQSNVNNVKTSRDIVAHVRRGDVHMEFGQTGDYYRYIPNSYFLDMIESIRKPNDRVIIFSQKTESFEDFVSAGYEVRLDTSVVEAWKTFIESDVFIISRSSFSYVPALFAKGIVVYTEYWSKPLKHWIVNLTFSPSPNRLNTIPMKEISLPCEGGEFGAQTIQTHACVISKETTIMFIHMPHVAQTVYPCWSWFAEKGTRNCAFFVQDNLSHKWFNFIAAKMGCFVIHKKPRKCAMLGILNTSLTVGVGESYSWLSSVDDATHLQRNVFRHITQNKGIGVIKRMKNRRIRNVDKMNLSAGFTYFEDISYYNQSKWMYEHDIIISAHGAAMTSAIFIRKCTVVIQLYPEHYYPCKFYEHLIKESGGIPISWIKNKYLGNDTAKDEENDAMLMQDFKQHHLQRGHWRAQDINIDTKTMNSLIRIAKEQQQRCRETNNEK